MVRCIRWRTRLSFVASAVGAAASAPAGYVGVDLYTLGPPASTGNMVITAPSVDIAADRQVVGWGSVPVDSSHALLWDAEGTPHDLHPVGLPGFAASLAYGTDGIQQVGYGFSGGQAGYSHALLWTGSAESAVDLHPTLLQGFRDSYATSVRNGAQVGFGQGPGTGEHQHALLWRGSAASAVDLSPTRLAGLESSSAEGTDATAVVGCGAGTATRGLPHALLWYGTADSAVDLQPTNLPGFSESSALSVRGNQEVGFGSGDTLDHALLWRNTSDSAVDLNPTGFRISRAYDTNGVLQVGWGQGDATAEWSHALLWAGSADSFVDLHPLLPGGFVSSTAFTIDAVGDVFGTATDSSGAIHAVEWVVPEPSICLLVSVPLLLRKRRVNFS